jgi:HAMP domain-containing protein
MASVVSILVTARNQTGAALNAVQRQTQQTTSRIGAAFSSLSRQMFAHTRSVSSVAGAYQDANGMWRQADGRLLTVRHTVSQVTTAYGRLVHQLHQVRNAALSASAAMGRLGRRVAEVGRDAFAAFLHALSRVATMSTLAMVGLAALVPLVANLSGLITLIAPATIAAGAAFGVLKLALSGVGDAITAGFSGDKADFAEKLKKLTPEAREFARSVVAIGQAWKSVQQKTQQSFFGGGNLPHWLRRVGIEFKPIVEKWLPSIAAGFSAAGASLAQFLLQPGTKIQIDTILREVDRFLKGILATATPLTQAFLDIAQVAAPSLGAMGESAGKLAQRFADWIRELRNSGQLAEWIERAKTTFHQLMEVVNQVGRIISAFFRGGNEEAGTFLENLRDSADALADFLHSENGQEMIQMFADIAGAVAGLINWFRGGIEAFNEFRRAVREGFGQMMAAAMTALGAIVTGAAHAFGWMPGIGGQLRAAAANFGAFRDQVNAALDGIQDEAVNVNVGVHLSGSAAAIAAALTGGSRSISRVRFQAHGGIAGGMTMVGERGRELVRLPQGSQVIPNGTTEAMMAKAGRGGGTMQVKLVSTGGSRDWLSQAIAYAVRRGDLQLKVVNGRVVAA